MVTAAASPPPCGHVVRPARYLHDFHLKQNFSLHCCARRWHNVYLCVCLVSIFMFIISLCPQFLVKPQIQPGGGLDMQREISSLFLCTLSLSVRDSLKSFSFSYRLDMQRQFSSLLYVHHPSLSPICSKLRNSTKVLISYYIMLYFDCIISPCSQCTVRLPM